MAMLAEPRRRSKYSVDPRGETWSKDDTKFGQKLMEKMGWSKGKGLGANEDGNVNHVAVQVKNDNRGVGCSRSHADNWIAHQDDFNALLSSLNENSSGATSSENEEKVSNLETKSKASKGRVHYMKFAKGKDLSVKNVEDLDCIFGRRKSKSNHSTPLNQSSTNTPRESDEEDSTDKLDDPVDNTHGVVTVKNELSVSDYFARKMAAVRAKLGTSNSTDLNGGANHTDIASANCEPHDLAKDGEIKAREAVADNNEISSSEKKAKKSKSKKNKKEKPESDVETKEQEATDKKKRKKKNKYERRQREDALCNEDECVETENSSELTNLKVSANHIETKVTNEVSEGTESSGKKTKKRKRSKEESVLETESAGRTIVTQDCDAEAPQTEGNKKSKKRKKNKHDMNSSSVICSKGASSGQNFCLSDSERSSYQTDTANNSQVTDSKGEFKSGNNTSAPDSTTKSSINFSMQKQGREKIELGFKGSNLGLVEGYAGGVAATMYVAKNDHGNK